MPGNWFGMRRRTFLGAAAAAAAGGTAIVWRAGKAGSAWRFFTSDEARTVEAICGQIIPADSDPGAKEAGVANYIDIQLTKHFKRHRQTYRRGIADVEVASQKAFGKPFADLPSAQQIAVLEDIEKHSSAFFNLILAHTIQGFYGDPRHGGNRDMASWRMLGLPCPPVRGRMHYPVEPKVG
jgi:gluconate 2-dehydrogenase gamma chain